MKESETRTAVAVQSGRRGHPFAGWMGYTPLQPPAASLYTAMREGVPIIDAALDKIVRLTGGFEVVCENPSLAPALDDFVRRVRVGGCGQGLHQFAAVYLDSLLTYGNAVGEMILTPDGSAIHALYNARLQDVLVREGNSPLEVQICTLAGGEPQPAPYPELILFTPLHPPAGEVRGVSLLHSLPFVTSVLLKVFSSIGVNFERIANLRYAVTYRPGTGNTDRAHAREIAEGIAREWSEAMQGQKSGVIKDFVAVGDVDIKVIGADNQMIDTQIPVRQMLEQIVAKLGLPPFMLGLHWSSTERMSSQQADILTSELWSYRRLMEGALHRIFELWMRLQGKAAAVEIRWDDINLQDEVESANARHINAQAELLEQQLNQEPDAQKGETP